MSRFFDEPGVGPLSRREFLKVGAVSAASMALPHLASATPTDHRPEVNCIFLFLTGGPSHLDTWDPKPNAPSEVRGPFKPIRTNVPGIFLSENFPRMAERADRFALMRSVYHDAPPIHETGQQLLQTGHLCRGGIEYPNIGSAIAFLTGANEPLMFGEIRRTGVSITHGQSAGFLGKTHDPTALKRNILSLEDQYRVGRRLLCQQHRTLTVNMFETVFNEVTWDCHADGGSLASNLDDYKNTLCPMFDQAYTALLDDLEQSGLLETTLVVAAGEFGRTPYINARGGRDHWPGCWTVLMAGGGVRGGQVIGASDRIGAEPRDRPVHAAEVAATIYHALGVDPSTRLPGPEGRALPLVEGRPVMELF
jgi:uncharacterized protein (DUF1501 family)